MALTITNVGASLGVTPKSRLFIAVVSHTPVISPMAIPAKTRPNPLRSTSDSTLPARGRFENNTSYGDEDAGFYVGNSPEADFTVQNNTAFNNLWGILVRDAATGSITGNTLHDSCSGLVFLNTGTSA